MYTRDRRGGHFPQQHLSRHLQVAFSIRGMTFLAFSSRPGPPLAELPLAVRRKLGLAAGTGFTSPTPRFVRGTWGGEKWVI